VWPRLAVNTAVLLPLALLAVRLPWRRLFAPSPGRIAAGVAAAAVLYGIGAAVFRLLQTVPGAAAQVAALYAWRDAAPDGLAIPLLLWIVLGEEIVWRTAVTLPLADRFGPARGAALAAAGFAAAHVSLGVPLLLVVALGAGAFWSALTVSSRNAVPALASHVLWDVAVLFLWPYV
jgi:membrane protease YdiL (CAAX protease family)